MFKKIVALLLIISLTACTTLVPIPATKAGMMSTLKPEDTVHITTRNHEQLVEKIHNITVKGLVTKEGDVIQYQDITDIKKKKISPLKTAGLGVGVVAGTGVLVVAAFSLLIIATFRSLASGG